MSESVLNLPAPAQHTVDAGLTLALVATFFDWLPKATALLVFIYYALTIIRMLRGMHAKRNQLRRRKTDAS